MNKEELERQIYENFSIARAMGMRVKALSTAYSELYFPLASNRNNIGTAFGGSLYSAAIFACYALYRTVLSDNRIEEGRFLNQKGEMEYLAPATGDFVARAQIDVTSEEFDRFILGMRRRGMSHLPMTADIVIDDKPVARFKASFLMTPMDRFYFQEKR